MNVIPLPQAMIPASVLKRDGRRVSFDPGKIESAIARAGAATGEFGSEEAGRLTEQVLKVLTHAADPERACRTSSEFRTSSSTR